VIPQPNKSLPSNLAIRETTVSGPSSLTIFSRTWTSSKLARISWIQERAMECGEVIWLSRTNYPA